MPVTPSRLRRFLRELKRRHVFKVGAVYAGTAFVMLQAAQVVFPSLSVPTWAFDLMVVLTLFGFPITVIVAWAFEITPEGVRRTPPAPMEESLAEESTGGLLRRLAALVGRDVQDGSAPHGPGSEPFGKTGTGGLDAGGGSDPDELRRASVAKLRHDLRSPINAIVGYAEMLLEEEGERPDPDAETATDLSRIAEAGRELQRVVDEVLRPDEGPGPTAAASRDEVEQDLHHRLRTPLNAVVGYSELLLERQEEAGRTEGRADVERILKAAAEMLERSEEIIRFCTAEAVGEATPEDYERVSGIARRALSQIRTVEVPEEAGGSGAAGSLLVVDDEERNRELYSRRLALQGYTVSMASDGGEALERMRGQEVDLVLLDLLMPGMDGAEVLRRMQTDEELSGIPVIVVSGLDEMDVAVRCLRSGAADFVTKPFDPSLLAVRVEAAIRTRRLRDEARRHRGRVRIQDELLKRVLFDRFPATVAERLRSGETEFVERFPEATVLSARIVGLPSKLSRGDPVDGLRAVTRLREWLRSVAEAHGIETLSFQDFHLLAAGGVPTSREDHADAVVDFGLALLAGRSHGEAAAGGAFRLRMGAHAGPVIAGVGASSGLVAYELWGEAVEISSALETSAPLDVLHVSPALRARLGDDRPAETRGVVEVGEQGRMRTFTLRPVAEGAA